MFKKALVFSIVSVGLMSALIIAQFVTIRPSDQALYAQIKNETKLLNSTEALERNPSTQLRKEARKDIWTENRTHFQMNADVSKLTLKQKKEKVEASEVLENMTCQNAVGKWTAKQGEFAYPNQHFAANQVTCTHTLGSIQAQTALLQSSDETLHMDDGVKLTSNHFTLRSKKAIADKNEQIQFFQDIIIQTLTGTTATGDQAIYTSDHLHLFPNENTYCHLSHLDNTLRAKEMDFDLKNQTVQCTQVHLVKENLFQIDADSCQITSTHIEINNNVHFQQNETFALADSILYHPQDQTLILRSIAPKRVFFWQEGVSLSAPEIHINKQQIEGKGDVRFTFHLEEQNKIDKHIRKYLYFPFLD